jgi:hypothetical protein
MSTKQELTDELEALRTKNEQLERLLAEHEERGDGSAETALATTGPQAADTPLNQLALAMGISDDVMEEGERVEDAMAKAITHDRKIREEMRGELAAARMVINRLAAIMGVQKWDADGSEIVEKAQRWVGFGGDLKRRIKVLETAIIGSYASNCLRYARIEEVTAMYARFMGTGDLAGWMATIPSDVSTVAMIEAASYPPPGSPQCEPEDADLVTVDDLRRFIGLYDERPVAGEWAALVGHLGFHPELKPGNVARLLVKAHRSLVAMDTLTKMLNLVILPHLRKIGE